MVKKKKRRRVKFFNTKPEKEMKKILKELGIKYVHGYSVWEIEHKYVADFYIKKYNMIVEVDGKYWHKFPYGLEIDRIREMKTKNYKVVRFWENEFTASSVKKTIKKIASEQ